MEKHDVEAYLKGKGIEAADLTGKAKEAFELYQASKELYEEDTSDNSIKVQFLQTAKTAIVVIEEMLKDKTKASTVRKKVAEKKVNQRSKSMVVVEEAKEKVVDLEFCKQQIRDEKKRKLESGEIKPPKKKTRVTKVKESFARILKLMPSEEPKDIEASEEALRECARKLFKINGMNQLEFVEKELEEIKDKRTPEKKEKKAA